MSKPINVTIVIRNGVIETAFVDGGAVNISVIDRDAQDEHAFEAAASHVKMLRESAQREIPVSDYEPSEGV